MMRMEEPLDKEPVRHIWSKKKRERFCFQGLMGLFFFYFYRLFIVAFNFQTFLIDLTDGRDSKVIKARILSKEPFYNIHIKS